MQFSGKLTRKTVEKCISDLLKVDFFCERFIGDIKKSRRKINQQDWILDLAIPVSIFAAVIVIAAILVLLKNN